MVAELRAQYEMKTPDVIQFAVGIENNGTLFVTNDKNLKKIRGENVQQYTRSHNCLLWSCL